MPYGACRELEFQIPRGSLLGCFGLPSRRADAGEAGKAGEAGDAGDGEALIAAALEAPVGSPRLRELAAGGRDAVVLCDDMTRPTPADRILPHLLNELNVAGIPDSAITIVMANGSHRPMTRPEIIARVGEDIAARVEAINHDYRSRSELVNWGNTKSGIPIWINRCVAGAGLVVGAGSIVPHRYCGWSGGAKIVQPGVCGEETTIATHLMMARDPGVRLGVVENSVRHEMEDVARQARLAFIVNTVLNSAGEEVGCVAGDCVLAHRAGVCMAEAVCAVDVPALADVVVVGSYPADLNFWQAGKAIYSADLAVRDGGTIVLVTPATEGVGEHPEFIELLRHTCEEIRGLLERGQVEDRLSAAAALAVKMVLERASLILVSDGLTADDARKIGAPLFAPDALQDAVDVALGRHRSGATVTVLREGADILPRLGRAANPASASSAASKG